jgi:rhodanese-related sulfurtransferase
MLKRTLLKAGRAFLFLALILIGTLLVDRALERVAKAWAVNLPGLQDGDLPIRFTFLSPAQLKQKIDAESHFTLLDVREEGEFRAGHITGAVNIPYHQIRARAAELDSSLPVIVYCIKAGRRSIIAGNTLSNLGFEVYNVDGGIAGWERAFPLSTSIQEQSP